MPANFFRSAEEPGVFEFSTYGDDLPLDTLPQPDYYNRATEADLLTQKTIVTPLVDVARDKLAGFLAGATEDTAFDKANNDHVISLIVGLKAEIKRSNLIINSPNLKLLKNQLVIAQDLLNINKLFVITIPNEQGVPMAYSILAEATGGATEKISLISLARLTTQLSRLRDAAVDGLDDYIHKRDNYKLGTEAFLKLPKHGKIEEVQRESMALNISRILGLNTTRFSIVSHNGKPALFVPFDNIKLMSEFAKGKQFNVFRLNPFAIRKSYQHYSTINPVGSGLQGDRFIDDFGNAFSLFYLCSDTDGLGGYNQNKGLYDSRSLFIFDQVLMSSEKMKLDSRLSLQPNEFILKHTRHGRGRNRTLIEDSSFNSKFNSLMKLLQQQERVDSYVMLIVDSHNKEIVRIDSKLREQVTTPEKKQLYEHKKQLTVLRDDALKLKTVLRDRIEKIKHVLPKVGLYLNTWDRRQALILEKLVHNPVLFTENGRPYKYPWTYRQHNRVKTVVKNLRGNLVITFDSKIPEEMVFFLQRAGLNVVRPFSENQLEMTPKDLAGLREDSLHPEARLEMQHDKNYLNINDLVQIGKAYAQGSQGQIISLIALSQKMMRDANYTSEEQLNIIENTWIRLQNYIDTTENKGFGMHVMKKFHFDVQQHLQAIISTELLPDDIDESFVLALKLDRVDCFNRVLLSAVRNKTLRSSEFYDFIQACKFQATWSKNYDEATRASAKIKDIGEQTLQRFNTASVNGFDLALEPIHDLSKQCPSKVSKVLAISTSSGKVAGPLMWVNRF